MRATKLRPSWPRLGALALATASLGLFAQSAQATVPGRLYIMNNGKIAAAIDPEGSFYARSRYRDMSAITGLQFKNNGVAMIALQQDSSSDPEALGSYYYHYFDGIWEGAPMPNSSGSLRFRSSSNLRMELEGANVATTWNMSGSFVEMFAFRKNAGNSRPADRTNFVNALLALQNRKYPGARGDAIPGGVSYWFKEDEIHQSTHTHGGPSFIPWHRELLRRFEADLRLEDPLVSLPYWQFQNDPRWENITASQFDPGFLGASVGEIGEPFRSRSFYRPNCTAALPCRNSVPSGGGEAFWATENPFDPPRFIDRDIVEGSQPGVRWDDAIVATGDNLPKSQQWQAFRGGRAGVTGLETDHNNVHGNVGGNIGDVHRAFQDPLVFLLHANVDRLWASWQRRPQSADPNWCGGKTTWRLDPNCVYGNEATTTGPTGIATMMEPWANLAAGQQQVRPWAAPESDRTFPSCTQGLPCPGQIVRRDLRDISVVTPPLYDYYAE
jgi:hypothetical protein